MQLRPPPIPPEPTMAAAPGGEVVAVQVDDVTINSAPANSDVNYGVTHGVLSDASVEILTPALKADSAIARGAEVEEALKSPGTGATIAAMIAAMSGGGGEVPEGMKVMRRRACQL